MNRKLIPITGALCAGILAVEGAACYSVVSDDCATANQIVGDITPTGCRTPVDVFAASNWGGTNDIESALGEFAVDVHGVPYICTGPAYYTDCDGVEQHISNFQCDGDEGMCGQWFPVTGSCP